MQSKKLNVTVDITISNEDYRCECEVSYYPGDPGRYSGPPEHCYPAEPDEVEILSEVWYPHAPHLTTEQEEDFYERVREEAAEMYEALIDAYYERDDDERYRQYDYSWYEDDVCERDYYPR